MCAPKSIAEIVWPYRVQREEDMETHSMVNCIDMHSQTRPDTSVAPKKRNALGNCVFYLHFTYGALFHMHVRRKPCMVHATRNGDYSQLDRNLNVRELCIRESSVCEGAVAASLKRPQYQIIMRERKFIRLRRRSHRWNAKLMFSATDNDRCWCRYCHILHSFICIFELDSVSVGAA